jgi:hypothetical protein
MKRKVSCVLGVMIHDFYVSLLGQYYFFSSVSVGRKGSSILATARRRRTDRVLHSNQSLFVK